MSVISLKNFGGMLPAVDDRLLPEHAASYSRDAYLYSGTLVGWRLPKLLFNLVASTTRAVFRVPADLTKTRITDTSYWLEFADKDTDVLRAPIVEDTFERYYYASPSVAPKYNIKSRIVAGSTPWLLGVPTPTDVPIVSPGGGTGTGIAASRAYVYTWVTAYGEESAPSPALVQNGYLDDTWIITVTPPVSNDMGVDRNIATTRIYRTVTGTDGTATFFQVTEIAATVATYNDTLSDAVVAQNVELPSATWGPPPSDLAGFVQGANGMIVGWKANEIWFCDPFRPHAWPAQNTITTEFPIVGMGVVGQSIIVLTKGYPVVVTGTNPSTVSSNVIKRIEPCVSKGSIVSGADGVRYISPNGLIVVTPYGGLSNSTETWIKRDDWHALVPLNSARAVQSGVAYQCFGAIYVDPDTAVDNASEAQVGFTIQAPNSQASNFNIPQGADVSDPAFGIMSAPNALDVDNFLLDAWSAVPMLVQSQKVYYYDFGDTNPTLVPYKWRSKVFQDVAKKNFEVMRLWFNVPANTPTQNVTRVVTTTIPTLASDMYGIVRVYAGDSDDAGSMLLHTTREIRSSGELLRILSGQKYEFWQWEFEGRIGIRDVQVATNVKELANA